MQTAESRRIEMPRISSGSAFGSRKMALSTASLCERSSIATTVPTAASLNTPFRNSVWPCRPKMRRQPENGDSRDSSGWMRSGTKRGAFCTTEATTPAIMNAIRIGITKRELSSSSARARSVASAPFSNENVPAPSRSRCSTLVKRATPSSSRKPPTISIAATEANIATSRETGTFPFSTESRIFFSVACSVRLSRSAVSDMTRRR
jgi:hypothetical protein